MVIARQEKGNKRAQKSMLRWRLARLARLRVELTFWRGTMNKLRVERLEARSRQLSRALVRDAEREAAELRKRGWRHQDFVTALRKELV